MKYSKLGLKLKQLHQAEKTDSIAKNGRLFLDDVNLR